MNKKLLILCYGNLASDPRVKRQIEALLPDFSIEACAAGASAIKQIPFYQIYSNPPFSIVRKIKRLLWLFTKQFDSFYWDQHKKELAATLSLKNYSVIIANDIQTLPLALRISGGRSKVYFDAHEYHPKEWTSLKWKLLYKSFISYMCKTYIPKADSFSTVSGSIADEYQKFTGIRPVVISNAGEYQELSPSTPGRPVKLIHHGAAIPERKIDRMMEMMRYLPDWFTLYLMLSPFNKKYLEKLKKKHSERIQFVSPVPQDKICAEINQYDIGVFLLPSVNFNYQHALPNKIFEFVQARLAVVTTPNPEMKKLIDTYSLGKVSENYTAKSMAEAITEVAERIPFFKSQSDKYAKELSAEHRSYKLIREMVFSDKLK